jgi:hypothetical protein
MRTIIDKVHFDNMISAGDPRAVHAIGKALVHLFNRQTDDEQATNDTHVHNARGFTGADAYSGSITAKYYLKHRTLLDWQVDRWVKKNGKGYARLSKYWKQINEEAVKKAQAAKVAV